MRNILVEITCKHCFYHTHIKSHMQVMVEFEPSLRQRILDNTMFTYCCPRCGKHILFLHNFLYCDTNHRFLIYLSEEKKDLYDLQAQFPTSYICQVYHPDELIEKIRILEDHLNDQVIEAIKERLKQREHEIVDIQYHDVDEDTLWFWYTYKDTQEMKGITYDTYQKMMEKGVRHESKRI